MDFIKAALDLRSKRTRPPWPPRRLALALQGGGSFGAFTWGALDRLLEDESIAFDAFSGASAGAVNAVLLASGLASGGREGARKSLEDFWAHVSQSQVLLPKAVTPADGFSGARAFALSVQPLRPQSAARRAGRPCRFRAFASFLQPAPADRRHAGLRTATLRIFRNAELTVDCGAGLRLPAAAASHHRDRRRASTWDGGYVANPPLTPLVVETRAPHGADHPDHADAAASLCRAAGQDIERRIDQINFYSTLDREIEAIRLLAPLCAAATSRANGRDCGSTASPPKMRSSARPRTAPANLDWSFVQPARRRPRRRQFMDRTI